MAANYPALRQLMAAYFHQDFDLEHASDDWEPVVDLFIRTEPGRISGAIRELDRILNSPEPDLVEDLRLLGGYYSPGDEPEAARNWLEAVRDHLRSAAEPD